MAAVATRTSQSHFQQKSSDTEEGKMQIDGEEEDEDEEDGHRESFCLPIQQHSRPATPADVVFERDVLALQGGKTEKELNKHYTLAAQDLGLEEPERRRQDSNDSSRHLDVPDSSFTVASSVRDSLSRTSRSTPPTSCGSSEMQGQQYYTAQSAAPSIMTSGKSFASRPPSVVSSRSFSSSIKNGFRRLSTFSRKGSTKVSGFPYAESTPSIRTPSMQAPSMQAPSIMSSVRSRRPSTSQSTVVPQSAASVRSSTYGTSSSGFSAYHGNMPKMLSPPASPHTGRTPRPLSRNQSLPSIASVSSAGGRMKNFSAPFSPTRAKSSDTRTINSYRPLTPTREEGFTRGDEIAAAEARTARSRDLQRLRSVQQQEQRRFLGFQREQYARIKSKNSDRVRAHRKLWQKKEKDLLLRQASKEAEMEQRQLNAELEMIRSMEAEKRSIEARLKHMEGYVKGRSVYESSGSVDQTNGAVAEDASSTDDSSISTGGDAGNRDSGLHLTASQFPARIVSSHSVAMLNQQYRILSQLPQLQASRINVLREQQAKHSARMQARHAVELNSHEQDAEDADAELARELREGENEVKKDFTNRRDRMEWRWKVAETMERKRLEDERGVPFAEFKPLDWSVNAWKGEE